MGVRGKTIFRCGSSRTEEEAMVSGGFLDEGREPISTISRDRASTDVTFVTMVEVGFRAENVLAGHVTTSLDLTGRLDRVSNYHV